MEFQFEPRNFVAGLLAGWITAFAYVQGREVVRALRARGEERTGKTVAYGGAEARYVRELIQFCQRNHLGGKGVALAEILVEPRFTPAEPLAALPDDDPNRDPFRLVPRVHDFPYLYAPYNVDTATIPEMSYGDRAIALLGTPGSGRTTALQAIALWSLGEVDFTPLKDRVQIQLEAEEAALKADERANRIKNRMTIEERARERLAVEQGTEYTPAASDLRKANLPLLKRLLPVYVHLANVDLDSMGHRADPAEPLVRAVQLQSSRLTAQTLPRSLYERLNRGGAILLLDGYDELPAQEQQQLLPWLKALIREYRRNFIVITGGLHGYGSLMDCGFTPVYMRPWHDLMIHAAAEKLANYGGAFVGQQGTDRPSETRVNGAKHSNRGYTALEIILRTRSIYAAPSGEVNPEIPAVAAIQDYLASTGLSDDQLTGAAQFAAVQFNEGMIYPERLQEIALRRASVPDEAGAVDQRALSAAQSTAQKAQTELLAALTQAGLLRRFAGNRYQFTQGAIAAYLASLTIPQMDQLTLRSKALLPAWDQVIAYAAGHTAIDAAVQARLEAPPDLLHTHLLTAVRWLAHAPENVSWRPAVMKTCGNLLLQPGQYPRLRERIASALVGAHDKSALVVLQRGMTNGDPAIRRVACLSLGAIREVTTVNGAIDAIFRLTGDADPEVQLAATLALGAIGANGVEQALEALVTTLTDGAEQLQRAAAEMFAIIPDEGYPVLYDAVQSQDIGLRRAAVFGLRRAPTPWALIEIYRVFLEDDQWYVRSAAQQVFIDMQNAESVHLRGYPPVEAIPWLREWRATAAGKDETISPDAVLLQMLYDAPPRLQAVTAQAIGQLGMVEKTKALYTALLNPDPEVRAAAHRGLTELQRQIGQPLPAPV